MESDSSEVGPSVVAAQNIVHPNSIQKGQLGIGNGLGVTVCRTDYFPSPPSTETESSGSVMAQQLIHQQRRGVDVNDGPQENTGQYYPPGEYKPEYKH